MTFNRINYDLSNKNLFTSIWPECQRNWYDPYGNSGLCARYTFTIYTCTYIRIHKCIHMKVNQFHRTIQRAKQLQKNLYDSDKMLVYTWLVASKHRLNSIEVEKIGACSIQLHIINDKRWIYKRAQDFGFI